MRWKQKPTIPPHPTPSGLTCSSRREPRKRHLWGCETEWGNPFLSAGCLSLFSSAGHGVMMGCGCWTTTIRDMSAPCRNHHLHHSQGCSIRDAQATLRLAGSRVGGSDIVFLFCFLSTRSTQPSNIAGRSKRRPQDDDPRGSTVVIARLLSARRGWALSACSWGRRFFRHRPQLSGELPRPPQNTHHARAPNNRSSLVPMLYVGAPAHSLTAFFPRTAG